MASIEISRALGMLAGVLIFLVGLFILKAKPDSTLHRLFFAFATADGVSTFAYDLSLVPSTVSVQLHARLVYFHAFIAFLTLLVVFALVFPRPVLPRRWRTPAIVAVLAGGALLMVWHALDPYAFWDGAPSGDTVSFQYRPAGLVVASGVVAATAALVVRLAYLLRTEPSPSHRVQAAFVLGGMALAYMPYATTTTVEAFRVGLAATLFSSARAVQLVYVTSLLAVLALLGAALAIFLDRAPSRQTERAFLLRCFGGVLVLTVPALIFPGRVVSDFLQVLGLVAWPILLAYAIARYEILDIGPTVRRTATLSLVTAVLAASFFVAEALLENALQARFAGALGAPLVAVAIAGIIAALVFAPIASFARRLAHKLAPELQGDSKKERGIEIYRHGLEAALADGVIDVTENRVLTSMRATLGISGDDHARLLTELRGRYAGAA